MRRVPFGSRFGTILHRQKNCARGESLKILQKYFFVERGFLFAVRFARLVADSSVSLGDFPLVDAFFRPDFFTRKRRFCRYYYSAVKKPPPNVEKFLKRRRFGRRVRS